MQANVTRMLLKEAVPFMDVILCWGQRMSPFSNTDITRRGNLSGQLFNISHLQQVVLERREDALRHLQWEGDVTVATIYRTHCQVLPLQWAGSSENFHHLFIVFVHSHEVVNETEPFASERGFKTLAIWHPWCGCTPAPSAMVEKDHCVLWERTVMGILLLSWGYLLKRKCLRRRDTDVRPVTHTSSL